MNDFNKRIYLNPGSFYRDLRFILRNIKVVREINKGHTISPEFRQRLMMAVTIVNGCRYCTYYHTRLSLKSGISGEELKSLLTGSLDDSPDEEMTALLYAQHWAEKNGQGDADFREKMSTQYGQKKAEIIELTLRTIRFGNLFGNTIDYLLYRLTFGKYGLT